MRKILILAGGILTAALAAGSVFAAPPGGAVLLAQSPPADLQPAPTDHVLGKPDAPVTIVEYASMTCPHCASFHSDVLPELKKKYIDTGKVRYVYRDFPLDAVALQAAQIAECAGNERYFAVLDLIFQTQSHWAVAKDPTTDLAKSLRIAGIGEADIKACLANDKIATAIVAERQTGEKLGVSSTPTLFINGERWTGARTIAALDEALAKILK